jgi:NTP pyrophosphatase (non-canonical NTP hydrolase)
MKNSFTEYQRLIRDWLFHTFSRTDAENRLQRSYRFLEEAMELVQATGVGRNECMQILDYVYARPVGEIRQEIGGVMVCLAAICSAHDVSLGDCAWAEQERIWLNVEKIRAKNAGKPKFSPLPGPTS